MWNGCDHNQVHHVLSIAPAFETAIQGYSHTVCFVDLCWPSLTFVDLRWPSPHFFEVFPIRTEAAEFLFDWSLFYGCYTVLLYNLPSWNPIALLLTFITVSLVNVMGHSGYDLPAWVYLPLSLGILGTPWSQRSRHHFIHHIDPRINRSLYFTWWDRIVGTFKDEHRMTIGKGQLDLWHARRWSREMGVGECVTYVFGHSY